MGEPKHILTTRPIDKESEDMLLRAGHQLHSVSFIHIDLLKDDPTLQLVRSYAQEDHTVVFTSMNAVQAVAACVHGTPKGWEVYSIGHATADKLSILMPELRLKATAPDATRLAERIIADKPTLPILFFCGDQRRDELPDMLKQAGLDHEELVVYHTTPVEIHLEPDHDAILFFSPSGVKSYFSVNRPKGDAVMFAIGETTAAEIRRTCENKVIVSPRPASRDLAAALITYFSEHQQSQ